MVGIAIATWRTGKEEDKVGKSVKNFIFFDSPIPLLEMHPKEIE